MCGWVLCCRLRAQAGNLLKLDQERQKLATDKQSFDFNAQSNPLILQQAQQTLEHNALNQPITWATNLAALEAQQLINADTRNKYNRGEQAYEANRFATAEYNKLVNSGVIHDPVAIAQYRTTLDPNDLGHAALLSKPDAQFKDSITPIGAPGSYTGAAMSAPQRVFNQLVACLV